MADQKKDNELAKADLEKVSGGKPLDTPPKDITINRAQTHDAAWHRMDDYIRG